jgi:hypothetical protein
MALDWNKPIGKPKDPADRASKEAVSAEKDTINLMVKSEHEIDARKAAPLAVILVVAIALFAKFAVFDPLSQVSQKQAELSQQQSAVAAAESKLTGYDDLKAQYDSYLGTSSTSSSVSAEQVMALIDARVASRAQVSSLSFDSGKVTIVLDEVSLDTVGDIATSLGQDDIVSSVAVSTASAQTSTTNVTATLVVTLVGGTDATTATTSSATTTTK